MLVIDKNEFTVNLIVCETQNTIEPDIGVRNAPSDTGTWGSSDSYIFYWNTSGAYR